MKKILLLITAVLFSTVLSAGVNEPNYEIVGSIDPTFVTATSVLTSSTTIVSAGNGIRNCLTEWDLMSTTVSDMKILNGSLASGTTLWALMQVPAGSRVFSDGILETALCGSTSTQMVIAVSSGVVSINYRGYVRKSP